MQPPHSASCKMCSCACVHISKCLVGKGSITAAVVVNLCSVLCVCVCKCVCVCVCVCVCTMAYLSRTNWSQYNFSTWARRGLLLHFLSDAIGGNCRPAKSLKTWPPILQWHVPEPQSLCIPPPVDPRVHKSPTDDFFSDRFVAKATGNFRLREQPSIRQCPYCLHYISGQDLLVSACTVLGVIVLSTKRLFTLHSDVVVTV